MAQGRQAPAGFPEGLITYNRSKAAAAQESAAAAFLRGTILNALRWLTGCGTQHPHRALGGTRVLLAAAPTTPPCFRHWRRSSSLLRIISGKIIIICGSETPAGVSEPLFHEWGTPSVIACGDATFPKGTASAVAGNFTALPKGVPLRADFPRPGEDVAQRQKGESGERSEPEGVIPVPQIFPPCQRLPPVKTGGAERPQTFRSPKFKSYFRY